MTGGSESTVVSPRRFRVGADRTRGPGRRRYRGARKNQWKTALIFLAPFLSVFLVFRFSPSVAGLLVSLTKWNIIGNPQFVGFRQFARMATDGLFYVSLKNTAAFTLMTAPPLMVLSLLMALLLDRHLRGRLAVRTIVFLPYVLMPAVIGLIWNWIFEGNFGILNYYLHAAGLKAIPWLTDGRTALLSVSITTVWWLMGFNTILYLAGLQEIPGELHEAARMDGASARQILFRLTLPMLAPVTSVILTLTLINVVKLFDQIFVMTGGGPGVATMTLVQYMYNQAFQAFDLGYGSALGLVILVVLVALILVQNRLLGGREQQP